MFFSAWINPTSYEADETPMSYADFVIFKEHKLLRSIFSNYELLKSDGLRNLKTFHGKFVKFWRIVVFLKNGFKTNNEFGECFNDDSLDFCKNNCADCSDFSEIKDINTWLLFWCEIKDIINMSKQKITETTLKFQSFHCRLMSLSIRDCEFFGNLGQLASKLDEDEKAQSKN